MIQKHQTACCALCQITASNEDSYEDLYKAIEEIKLSTREMWHPSDRRGGETTVYVITAPGEDKLVKNLRDLGFVRTLEFPRRNGYQPGRLKMWTLLTQI